MTLGPFSPEIELFLPCSRDYYFNYSALYFQLIILEFGRGSILAWYDLDFMVAPLWLTRVFSLV
ncbi:MAG TPA: hypothetical protein DIV47_02430 [Candidatus Pacebacteria bacterium]|nr:hypothetical protein [Candidatus Paceibacterota bacterium]